MDVSSLIAMLAAFCVVAIAPGPATLACASVSMAHGRQAGLRFGAGLAGALLFWGVLAAAGLGAVLATSALLMVWLKVFGGLYLLWLAWKSGRTALKNAPEDARQFAPNRWMRRGVMLNLSNPKAIFAWLATLSLGVGPQASLVELGLATALCGMVGFLVYLPWIWGFSHPKVMQAYRAARRWVDGAVALAFSVAGVALIRSAFARAPS